MTLFIKKIKRAAARNMLYGFRWIISKLPYSVYRVMSIIFIPIASCVMVAKNKLILEMLSFAYGEEKSLQERKEIVRNCFRNFSRDMLDLIYYLDHRDDLRKNFEFEGKEHLDAVLKKGKGAVILSAHFGNFISMFLRLIQEGYKINVVTRKARDGYFEKYISNFRNSNALNTIYADSGRQSIGKSIKALRANEMLIILLDQNYGRHGGVFVDFFGKKAATATGPLIFSTRTQAPILPMFPVYQGNRKHKIIIEPPIKMIQSDSEEALVENISRLTQVIERYVRKYPDQWGGWMHKRWKTEYKGQNISK